MNKTNKNKLKNISFDLLKQIDTTNWGTLLFLLTYEFSDPKHTIVIDIDLGNQDQQPWKINKTHFNKETQHVLDIYGTTIDKRHIGNIEFTDAYNNAKTKQQNTFKYNRFECTTDEFGMDLLCYPEETIAKYWIENNCYEELKQLVDFCISKNNTHLVKKLMKLVPTTFNENVIGTTTSRL